MSRAVWNATGQAVSSPINHEVVEQEPGHMAWRSEECIGEALTDTDSYQTADDDERNISTDADVDPPNGGLQALDREADRRQGSPEFESSSSSEESHDDEKGTEDRSRLSSRRSEPEKRRKSYQFAMSKSEGLIPNVSDDAVVNDLDPFEFHHQQLQAADGCDEDSDRFSDCVPVDLDPREFSHPSVQLVMNTDIAEDDKAGHDGQSQSNSGLSEASLHKGPPEALQLSDVCSSMCSTERHESVVEGSPLPTILIPSPTERILDSDHQEWFMLRCTKRAVFDFSLALERLPLFTASENVNQSPIHVTMPVRVSPVDEKQVYSRLYDDELEPLPIVEATISETTELIRARLIETAALWESFQYGDVNLSSSPEKYDDYPFEVSVPSPDYESFMSESSDANSEAGDDAAVDADARSDIRSRRADRSRSPTPDYDTLSPVCERDAEFSFDSNGHNEPVMHDNFAGEVRSNEVKVRGVVGEFDQPLLLAPKGSQRFPKPVQHSTVTVESALTEQADEDEERKQDADVAVSIEPAQHSPDSQHYRSGMETAPVYLSSNDKGTLWQSQAKSQVSSGDQPNVYATLGSSSEKRKRISKRSVGISLSVTLWVIGYTEFIVTVLPSVL